MDALTADRSRTFVKPDTAAFVAEKLERAKRRLTFKQRLLLGLASAALLGAAWYGFDWWTVGRFFQDTDDAYVGGNVTPISPHISGFIAEIAVTDNQLVKAGQLLIRLDDRMADLDRAITVRHEGKTLYTGTPARTIEVMCKTLFGRGDPKLMFDAEVLVELPSGK